MAATLRDERLDDTPLAHAASAAEPLLDSALVRAVLEEGPDGVVIVDRTGRMLFANRRIEELFAYDRGELVGQPVEVLVPEESRAVHADHRARYGATPRRRPMGAGVQLAGRRRDGTCIPVEISLSPVTTPSGTFTVAVVRDISGRLRAEEELRAAQEELTLLEDRERIARDLHDTVLQRIFATGLSLQAAASQAPTLELRDRIERAISELDTTIREIRTTIFDLHAPPGGELRETVRAVAAEATRPLTFAPAVRFEGPVDTAISDQIAGSLAAVLREALSNVARHAHARSADVVLAVTDDHAVLRIADDGVGLPAGAADEGGRGLCNMRQRAESLGGECRVFTGPGGGTVVEWRVPLTLRS